MRCQATLPLASSAVDSSEGDKRILPWILKVRFVPTLTWSFHLILPLIIAAYHSVSIYLRYLQSPAHLPDFLLILAFDNDPFVHEFNSDTCREGYFIFLFFFTSPHTVELKVFFCFPLRCRVSNKLCASSHWVFYPIHPNKFLKRPTHFWNCWRFPTPPVVIVNFFIPKPFSGCGLICCTCNWSPANTQ